MPSKVVLSIPYLFPVIIICLIAEAENIKSYHLPVSFPIPKCDPQQVLFTLKIYPGSNHFLTSLPWSKWPQSLTWFNSVAPHFHLPYLQFQYSRWVLLECRLDLHHLPKPMAFHLRVKDTVSVPSKGPIRFCMSDLWSVRLHHLPVLSCHLLCLSYPAVWT